MGKTAGLKLEAASGEVGLREFTFAVPPSLAGAKLKAVKGTLGGVATRPGFRQTGNAVRILWLQPVTVKPGGPLVLEVQF